MKQIILTIAAGICIIIATLSVGVVICVQTPQITQNLSRATALVDSAHFTRDQLVSVADLTRSYIAGEASKDDLYTKIEEINKQANTQYSELEKSDFAAVSDEYSLDSNSIQHLTDVQKLMANVKIAFGLSVAGAILFSILLVVFIGPGALGRVFKWSGLLIIIAFAGFAIWAIIDFNAMFNWLHSLFFASGSWLFSAKSLLIVMYPESFWIGMGAICLAISSIISIVLIFVGKVLK